MRSLPMTALATVLACLTPRSLPAGSITVLPSSAGVLNYFPSSPTPFFAPFPTTGVGNLSIYSDWRSGRNEADVALDFDLSALRGQTVLGATLDLTANGAQMITSGPSLTVTPFLDDDPVVDITDFARATGRGLNGTGALPLFAAPGTIAVPLSYDATSFVQSAVASSTPYAGLALGVIQAGVFLDGFGAGANAPRMVVVVDGDPPLLGTVPAPGGVVLLGIGLACMCSGFLIEQKKRQSCLGSRLPFAATRLSRPIQEHLYDCQECSICQPPPSKQAIPDCPD